MTRRLADDDEFGHEAGPEPNWQENYFFLGFDEIRQAGFYLHSARIPCRQAVEIKALASVGGRTVSVRRSYRADDNLALPGIHAEIAKPFRRWHVGYSDTGREAPGTGPGVWLADGDGEVPFGFSVDLESPLAPLDWGVLAELIGVPDILTEHYETAGQWSGEVWLDGQRTGSSGLFIRDHTWGPRDFGLLDLAWWTPMYFPDAGLLLSGTSILRGGRWTGFLLRSDDGETKVTPDPWMRIDGFPEPWGYDSASILSPPTGDRFAFRRLLHVPCRYPEMGDGHLMHDMLSSVSWGDERGFGVFELNRHEPRIRSPKLCGGASGGAGPAGG